MTENSRIDFYDQEELMKEIIRLIKLNVLNVDDSSGEVLKFEKECKSSIVVLYNWVEDSNLTKNIETTLPNTPFSLTYFDDDTNSYSYFYIGSRGEVQVDDEEVKRDWGYPPTYHENKDRKNLKNKLWEKFEEGKPIVVGDFQEEIKEKNIKKKDIGLFHEVILTKDNKLIGRGSNENKQLEFNFKDNIIDFVCGHLFTAVLYEDGTVDYCGLLGPNKKYDSQPIVVSLDKKKKFTKGLVKNKQKLNIKITSKRSKTFTVFSNDILLGSCRNQGSFLVDRISYDLQFYNLIPKKIVTYEDSQKKKQAKPYLSLVFVPKYMDYLKALDLKAKGVSSWKNIIEISKNYNGLIGIDDEGRKFVDGLINPDVPNL